MYVDTPNLIKQIEAQENKIKNNQKVIIRDSVTADEVMEVISKTTGIPLNKLMNDEKTKLMQLKISLGARVKGQDAAIDLISQAVLRSRAGINDPNRPTGSFLFLGPTGVGKTELAKALAYELFDSQKAMVRFDMSEFMEKHSVSKLIGAPPGYVGYEQAGALTEAIRRRPYSVILFDEIEKAHADVLNILLQVLDDGQLKDSQGRLVNFKNTIIIMTSNIGHSEILEDKSNEAINELKKYLKPEFINRIDEIIIFNKLSKKIVNDIVVKLLDELVERLKNDDINIKYTSEVVNKISSEGYDAVYGARPIKRYIQKNIENMLASKIVDNTIIKNKPYTIDVVNNNIVISKQSKN
jgi:ATP-dependent Clp protease ATP-binding subunit ClpB